MIQQFTVLADYHSPQKRLAFSVLLEGVKSIKRCPQTIESVSWSDKYAKTRLRRALEALDDAHTQSKMFVFWCEVAEIDVNWISSQIKALAEDKPLLMKAWEAQNNVQPPTKLFSKRN